MKVLFIVDVGEGSGIRSYANDLATSLEKKGISIDIDTIKKDDYDLIHIHNAFPSLFLFQVLAKFHNVPIVYSANMTENQLQGMTPFDIKSLARQYLHFFYSRCNKIICPSERIYDELKEYNGKVLLLHYPINLEVFKRNDEEGAIFRKKYGIPSNKKIVLCVASIQERKGIFDFLDAAKAFPEYLFLWVGTIPAIMTLKHRRKLEKLVKSHPSNVLFVGAMKRDELRYAYNAADLFVLASYSETFGLVIAEAACCGTPVLIRNLPEFSYFKDFAEYFSSQAEFKEKIKHILENNSERKKLQQHSINARNRFDIEKHVEKVLDVYNSVLHNI